MAPLPALALQGRQIGLFLRITDAKMSDKGPVLRHAQDLLHSRRIEDRHPADSDALGPRRTPQRVDGDSHRIVERRRHREAPQPMSLRRRVVRENGDLTPSVIEARELQPRIARSGNPSTDQLPSSNELPYG